MFLNRLAIKLILKYQSNHSRPKRCRHIPTCSNYGLQCYQKFNFFKASFLTAFRILRCNPFSNNVYDPVPLSKKEHDDYLKLIRSVSYIDDKLVKIYQENCFEKRNYQTIISYLLIYLWDNQSDYNQYLTQVDRLCYLIKKKIIKLPYKKSLLVINQYLLSSQKDPRVYFTKKDILNQS